MDEKILEELHEIRQWLGVIALSAAVISGVLLAIAIKL